MYATVLPTHLVATVGLGLQPLLNCRAAVADVTADSIPDRSFASVPPAVQRFDRNAEHLGQLWQSHKPLSRFLAHDHLPFLVRMRPWSAGCYLATPDRQVACSWPSLWITAAAANPYRLPKVANCRWRSFSAEKFGAERTAFVRRPTSDLLGTSLTLLRGAAGPVHVPTRSTRKCHATG
jgi:hypothetical protein